MQYPVSRNKQAVMICQTIANLCIALICACVATFFSSVSYFRFFTSVRFKLWSFYLVDLLNSFILTTRFGPQSSFFSIYVYRYTVDLDICLHSSKK